MVYWSAAYSAQIDRWTGAAVFAVLVAYTKLVALMMGLYLDSFVCQIVVICCLLAEVVVWILSQFEVVEVTNVLLLLVRLFIRRIVAGFNHSA